MPYESRRFNVAFTRALVPILSRINPIARINAYFFNNHSNIDPRSRLGPPEGILPVGLSVNILKAFIPSSILDT